MHITAPFDPKSLKLSWITGTSFGLTPFWSDSIDYVACAIPVRDVTNINIVNPHWDNTTWVYLIKKYPLCVSSLIMILSPYISPNARWLFWVTKCKVIILRFILKLHQDDVHNLKGANTDREGGKTSRCIVFDTRKWWLLLCILTYATPMIYIKTFANECVYL